MGNAVLRRFPARDLFDHSRTEMEKDTNIFRTEDGEAGHVTALKDGLIVLVDLTDHAAASKHQMAVWDYGKFCAARRIERGGIAQVPGRGALRN